MKAILKMSIVTFVLAGFLVLCLAFLMEPVTVKAQQLSQEVVREFLVEGIMPQLGSLADLAPTGQSQSARITTEQAFALAIQGETGADDFRISDMGRVPDNFDGFLPAVAYNPTQDEYLVVWNGDDNLDGMIDGEFEIFGQLISGVDGAEIGEDFRISDMGPETNVEYKAVKPAVAYNATENEYLVVWEGDDNTGGLVDEEFEIFGQRIDATDGTEIGPDFRISYTGGTGSEYKDARSPAIAYNSLNNEYLVVFESDELSISISHDEFDIYGQRLNGTDGTEIGSDFRISDMGPDGAEAYDAISPAVVYNSIDNEYLVVWYGDDNEGGVILNEFEIFGQRLDAASGAEIGGDFRISDMGPDGVTDYAASRPAVAYNSTNNQYLVVWDGDDNTGTLINDEKEIFGQRLDAADGTEIGEDYRISDMGPDGTTVLNAFSPTVAYNVSDNVYLVAWHGDDDSGGLVNNEFEIFGQILNAVDGTEIGADIRISDMGPDGAAVFGAFDSAAAYGSLENQFLIVWSGSGDNFAKIDIYGQHLIGSSGNEIGQNDFPISDVGGDLTFDAFDADVAFNSMDNEYLVVWRGDDNTADQVDGEFEIFGQRLDGITGAELGAEFRISFMGPNENEDYDAFDPAVVYNPSNNQYLVVWRGDDDTGGLIDDEFEIYGQRLEADTGNMIGSPFRISAMGPDGDADYGAFNPAVVHNSTDNQYLVAWHGDSQGGGLIEGELEIFIQRLDASDGTAVGGHVRVSDMGPDGDSDYDALFPAVAYNSTDGEYLVTWHGDDDSGSLVNEAFEIFGQRIDATAGTEIGSDFRISALGPEGDIDFDARDPAAVYDGTANQYLVVWEGDDDTGGLVEGEVEIFGQRLNGSDAAEIGSDFRISAMGPDGDSNYDAGDPDVIYDADADQFLVVWEGEDDSGDLVDSETEIFGQRLDAASGMEIGDAVRLSAMGEDGDFDFDAFNPAAAYNSVAEETLVVWQADDDTGELVDEEFEIFGQRYQSLEDLYLPIIRRDN